MSYTKLFLLGVGLALFNVAWWKAVIAIFLFVVVSVIEKQARERRLKKIIDNEFDEGWATYEFDSTIEVKDQVARLKLEGDKDKAMLSRLSRLMYQIALAHN
jgi:hypothetical protein